MELGPEKFAFVSWCKDPENIAQLEDLLDEITVPTY